MTYRERIILAIKSAINGTLPLGRTDQLAEAIEAEFQNEFYLADHCLAMVDPSQPEYIGACPVCNADLDSDSDQTHSEHCALAAVIPEGP